METNSIPQSIVLTANPWTLTEYPDAAAEWSLGRKLEFFAEAGCTAVTFDAADAEAVRRQRALALRLCGFFREPDGQSLDRNYLTQVEAGAETINCFLGTPAMPADEAVSLLLRLQELEAEHGVACHVETHRATVTENPDFARQILLAAKEQSGTWPRICWDHSHLAVAKHFSIGELEPWLQPWDSGLVEASAQLHLRPFNGHHAQIPVIDHKDQFTPEFRDWWSFACRRLQQWSAAHSSGDELWIVPELGPVCHGYGLSVFPDVTSQLRQLMQLISP